MSKIIDISLPITAGMPVYPGDARPSIQATVGDGITLSDIRLGSHTGTHVDAPKHFIEGAAGVDSYVLDTFYGPCRVLDLTGCPVSISRQDLEAHTTSSGERILFKTKNSIRGYDKFYKDFIYLRGEAAQFLADLGVKLVGTDCLSVEQMDDVEHAAHMALLSRNIPIIEGLDLSKASEGEYTLCAFPLSLKGIDGSPLRAVLISD